MIGMRTYLLLQTLFTVASLYLFHRFHVRRGDKLPFSLYMLVAILTLLVGYWIYDFTDSSRLSQELYVAIPKQVYDKRNTDR